MLNSSGCQLVSARPELTPSTIVGGYTCEFLQSDGSIIWRHSPIDITGGMP